MKPAYMLVPENPPHSHGDCIRACVASIFELPTQEVPHFAAIPASEGGRGWFMNLAAWAAARGFALALSKTVAPVPPADPIFDFHHIRFGCPPDRAVGHAAIYLGERCVHDPDPTQRGEYLAGVYPQFHLYFVKM